MTLSMSEIESANGESWSQVEKRRLLLAYTRFLFTEEQLTDDRNRTNEELVSEFMAQTHAKARE